MDLRLLGFVIAIATLTPIGIILACWLGYLYLRDTDDDEAVATEGNGGTASGIQEARLEAPAGQRAPSYQSLQEDWEEVARKIIAIRNGFVEQSGAGPDDPRQPLSIQVGYFNMKRRCKALGERLETQGVQLPDLTRCGCKAVGALAKELIIWAGDCPIHEE